MTLENLSNHLEQGLSHLALSGNFIRSGATRIHQTFLASGGAEFAANIEIINTKLAALNPLLRAHGRIDAAEGLLTVYSQIGLKNSRMSGYVKPIFSNVQVYGAEKDKSKNVLQQARTLLVGAAAHVLKNRTTKKVASQVSLTGDPKNPQISTWQAFVEVIRNAFIQAILPGFDRQVNPSGDQSL
jgi:hypothetical protein